MVRPHNHLFNIGRFKINVRIVIYLIKLYLEQYKNTVNIFVFCTNVFRTNVSFLTPVDYRLVYSPQSPVLDQLVAGVVNDLALSGHFGVASADALESELLEHSLLAGIEFDASVVSLSIKHQITK